MNKELKEFLADPSRVLPIVAAFLSGILFSVLVCTFASAFTSVM